MAYTYEHPRPALTVDAIVFRPVRGTHEVLLIQRKNYPFEGKWALPGGFVDMDETAEDAVVRELEEETGLKGIEMEQLRTFSQIDRDPRGRTVSVVYYGFTTEENDTVKGADDASAADWFPLDDLPPLAFDHEEIIHYAMHYLHLKV